VIGTTQPITISVWGFTSTLSSAFVINSYSNSLVGSQLNYLVSTNSATIVYSLAALTSCIFPCKLCSSNNISICLQCYSSAITQQYYIDSYSHQCVTPSSCSSVTYPNTTSNSCILCLSQCSKCINSTFCTACATNYYLLNGNCLTDCPTLYYPITPQQSCASCDGSNNTAHCSTCIDINVCSSCKYPYLLNPSTKICVATCSLN